MPGAGVGGGSDVTTTSTVELSSSGSVSNNESGGSLEREVGEEATGEPVYVCGDSHTLTPAWQEISVGGRCVIHCLHWR